MAEYRRNAGIALVALMLAAGAGSAQERAEVHGMHAAVVADHPLAAAAGAEALRRGGNAVDAAITMAAVLAVVRPHMSGIGGDAFLLIRDGRSGRVYALNGSGRAGERATLAEFRARGITTMPQSGALSVTVPGAVRAWSDALRRHGTISLEAALAPAIRYASEGFPVSEKLAADIAASRTALAADSAMAAVFLPGGEPLAAGSILRLPELAHSLQLIARDGADALYTGELARAIVAFMARERGLIDAADLAQHSSTWQQPISTTYAGYRVLAFPPNTQGIALLLQMNLAELFDLRTMGHNSADYVHTLVELKKLAFAERDRHITDPAFVDIPLDQLLSKEFARDLAGRRAQHSGNVETGRGGGDTVFACVVDAQGNAVALSQSLYDSFGSGRMVPGTGIVLHNRAGLFSLDAQHVNAIAPRKRTYHTLAPAMALYPDKSLFLVFGTPGADGQTQTQLQVFNNIVLFGMTPQRAVEAPRWRSYADGVLQLEDAIPAAVQARLSELGHRLRVMPVRSADLGGAQVILVSQSGGRATGADPRREAYGIAW
jgi:gamma-glutamyltranspeptidase